MELLPCPPFDQPRISREATKWGLKGDHLSQAHRAQYCYQSYHNLLFELAIDRGD